jgi:hypothetical protein
MAQLGVVEVLDVEPVAAVDPALELDVPVAVASVESAVESPVVSLDATVPVEPVELVESPVVLSIVALAA